MGKNLILKIFIITFQSILFYTCYGQNWEQLGSNIVEQTGNRSASVSSNGQVVALGIPSNGLVQVYTWTGTEWMQMGNNIAGTASGDQFGHSVSLSSDGQSIAVGAISSGVNGEMSGQVRFFVWDQVNWIQLGDAINGEDEGDQFGYSVSLSSDGFTLAIGAVGNDGSGLDAGHVRVYQRLGANWIQIGNDIDGESAGDHSGYSVSLSGNAQRVAIGAPDNYGFGGSGHVRIYRRIGSSWLQLGNDIDGEAPGDECGSSVSLSSDGTKVAIGGSKNDGNGGDAGHVRIFTVNGSEWLQQGNDIDGESSGDNCGNSVSLSSNGETVAIGAVRNDGNGENSGQIRIYYWCGESWIQIGNDIDGESSERRSGYAVSLSGDGETVVDVSQIGSYARAFILNSSNNLYGCTEPNSCNYNTLAVCDDGSCSYISEGDCDCNGTLLSIVVEECDCNEALTNLVEETITNFDNCTITEACYCECINDADQDGICDELEWSGCQDQSACNYSPNSTDEDNSLCIYPGNDCDDLNPLTFLDYVNEDCFCGGFEVTGIDENSTSSISVYPNPCSSNFTINTDGKPQYSDYRLYDMTGKEVHRGFVGSGITNIEINTLASGIYSLVILSKDGDVFRQSLVVQREE